MPGGAELEQADGTAWMAFYCNTMLAMALELASFDPGMEDIASKFFEHFVNIADAINTLGGTGLWDEQDGFYYDQVHADGHTVPLRLRSHRGPGAAAGRGSAARGQDRWPGRLPQTARTGSFAIARTWPSKSATWRPTRQEHNGQHLLAIPSRERLLRVLRYMLDENEFLSPFGIRSLSKRYAAEPYVFRCGNEESRVQYLPGESDSGLFGGNSNWRGPIWFPLNYLLIGALGRYHEFYGQRLQVECPTGSGRLMTLDKVARELAGRLAKLFRKDPSGRRPYQGSGPLYDANEPLLFYEYFDAETGRGLGASHQTGWTSLVASCLERL